jgi:hypothetical protein
MDFVCEACGCVLDGSKNKIQYCSCSHFCLCEKCYVLKACIDSRYFLHPNQKSFPSVNDDTTSSYRCNVCKIQIPDFSPRFHCLICDDYDLCARCERIFNNLSPHSNSHPVSCFLESSPFNRYLISIIHHNNYDLRMSINLSHSSMCFFFFVHLFMIVVLVGIDDDDNNANENGKDSCLICFQDAVDPVSCVSCKKVFCKEHILEWLRKCNSSSCPHCSNRFY